MAMNPMQRRARNSFLTGMLVTLVVMAIVVVLLLSKINQLNEDKEKLIALQQQIYVAAEDIKSGEEVTVDLLIQETVQTSMDTSNVLTVNDFAEYDEEGNEYILEYISKLDIPAGTIITKDMVSETDNQLTADQRIQEYNMIVLPSQLRNGQFIDIRFKLANGNDYIVLSKKKVIQCTSDTIWIKLAEDEILTLGNAIVEAYQAPGSKLYATTYIEAGLQDAAVQTYVVGPNVYSLIQNDPNVLEQAKSALWARYNDQAQVEQRTNHIEPSISYNTGSVQSGTQSEVTAMKSAREAFVEELEGTGEVGIDTSVPLK